MRLEEFLKEEDESLCEDLPTQLKKFYERLDLLMKAYSVKLPNITRAVLDWDFLCKLIEADELNVGKDVGSNIYIDNALGDKTRNRIIISGGGLQVAFELSNRLESRYHLDETSEDVGGTFRKFDYWLAKIYQMTGAELFITEVVQKYVRSCSFSNGEFTLVKEAHCLSDIVALTWAGFRCLSPKAEVMRKSILKGDKDKWLVVNPPREADQSSLLADNLMIVERNEYEPRRWGNDKHDSELYYGRGRVALSMGYQIKCPVPSAQGIEILREEVREKVQV